MTRELLVDDGHARCAGGVGAPERASTKNGQAHRVEVVLVHAGVENGRAVFSRRKLEAFRHDRDGSVSFGAHWHRGRERDGGDAGDGSCAIGDLLEELLRLRAGVPDQCGIETHHQEVIGAKSGTGTELPLEVAVHERREHQQDNRTSHLAGDEQRSPPTTTQKGTGGIGRLHHRGQIRARPLNRRRETEQPGADDRHDQAIQQCASIELERQRNGQVRRQLNQPEEPDAGERDEHTEKPADRGNQRALGHQLTDQPATSGADREAQGDLARAYRSAAGQETRNVRARHEEHHDRQGCQHRDDHGVGSVVRHPRLQLGADHKVPVPIGVGIHPLEIPADQRELRLRFGLRDAGTQASLDRELPRDARVERVRFRIGAEARPHHQRRVERDPHELVRPGEGRRHDADDRELQAVEPYGPPDDLWISSELLLPDVVSQDDHGVASRHLVLVGAERPSYFRLDAHDVEEVSAHEHPVSRRRLRCRVGGKSERVRGEARQAGEGRVAIADLDVLGVRGRELAEPLDRGDRSNCQDLGGTGHRQRAEQQGIGEAEHGGIGADADGQRDDGNRGKTLVSREEPGPVPQIAHQVVEPGQPPLIAKRFHGVLEVARFQPGRSRRALGRLAAALRLLGRQIHVEPQLLFEVTIRSPRADRAPQAVNPFTERTHTSPRFTCSPSSVCMIVDVRAQSAFSLAS